MYFPEWRAILDLEPLDPLTRDRFARSIIGFLSHCKTTRERVSIAGAKRYLDAAMAARISRPSDREALRWFFLTYRRIRATAPSAVAYPVSVQPQPPCQFPQGLPPGKKT